MSFSPTSTQPATEEVTQADTAVQQVARLVFKPHEVCSILGGIAPITLWRLEKKKLLLPVPGLGRSAKLYSRHEIERFLSGNQKAGRS